MIFLGGGGVGGFLATLLLCNPVLYSWPLFCGKKIGTETGV